MTHDSASQERSLLDELDELQVIEADQLQEGVAFHAFKFHMQASMESLVLTFSGAASTQAGKLVLPQGAALLDVEGDKMRIVFDPNAVVAEAIVGEANKAFGNALLDVKHDNDNDYKLVKVPK